MKVKYRTRNWYGHIYDEKRRAPRTKNYDGNETTRGAREEGLRGDGWIE